MVFLALLVAFLGVHHVHAKAVFAHFMVGNTVSFDVAKWKTNMQLAQSAHIDAFVLNLAYGWPDNDKQIGYAFTAANSAGFKLFFSFDYAGSVNSTWPLENVRTLIRTYGQNAAHYQYNGKPLVSTFEGPNQAADWKIINSGDTACFFIPDYSSLGSGPAVAAGGGVAQGLFSWAAWPTGKINSTTYVDASYKQALAGKPYMMPLSPWFFTNMPGFDKNWLWNSGDLWHQRWQQVISLDFEPEFLEIISWNDYGESHYIGPLDDTQYEAFAAERGNSPYNYVKNMPHDGWREHLAYYIDLYKTGTATFTKESIVTWFRTSLAGACADGETTGNTASQLQYEYSPLQMMPDRLYFSALLTIYAELKITYGGGSYSIKNWDSTPDGGVGVYHASLPIDTTSGAWSVAVVRNGVTVIDYAVPQGVSGSCPSGLTNWNPWVGSKEGAATVNGKPPRTIAQQECVEGWGPGNFATLCNTTCTYGYCPSSACVCTSKGMAKTKPKSTGVIGYRPTETPTTLASATSPAIWASALPKPAQPRKKPRSYQRHRPSTRTHVLRDRAAEYRGPLNLPPPEIDVGNVTSNFGKDNGLCKFACTHGFCPDPECSSEKGDAAGLGGTGSMDTVVAYFEGRHLVSTSCDQRSANFVPTDSVTHVNVAFAWIEPDSFDVYPGNGFGPTQIQEFLTLKRQASGLKVWITVGGWDFSNGKGASTGTQGVFSKLAGTPENRATFISALATFLRQFALDGVDLDWEWPGASDTANYAALVKEMRMYFDKNQPSPTGWGISFTAPLDIALLGRYDLTTMVQYTDWINLQAYDLESGGVTPTTTVPSSNMQTFDTVLAAFTKAGVPSSRINLGLGFFGRSYSISLSCSSVSCPATGFGVMGSCSGTAGFMGYSEIESMISRTGSHANHDGATGTNYFMYGDNTNPQWISYDNPDTIVEKVKYAKEKGLRGLAVWSIELDNDKHDLLNATLYPVGLGGVSDHTGAGASGPSGEYTDVSESSCFWSSCQTSKTPACPSIQQVLTVDRCSLEPGTGKTRYKALCCPLDKTPDSKFCDWQDYAVGVFGLGICIPGCSAGYVSMAEDPWIINAGGEGYCQLGRASYCCQVSEPRTSVCGWQNTCVSLGSDLKPTNSAACPSGMKFVTYAKGIIGGSGITCEGDESQNSWVPYCCNNDVDISSFEWNGARGYSTNQDHDTDDCPTYCPSGKTLVNFAKMGDGADCQVMIQGYTTVNLPQTQHYSRPLCVDPSALMYTVNTLPVPLKNLFPGVGSERDSDKQKWKVSLDPSMGGADSAPETSSSANDNSFGWYIMSGPAAELISLDKRDGSHWELFNCHDALDVTRRHTVRAVCITDGAEDSNCNDIYLGTGVAETVVEMPPSCGPGKYAMAVSLTPSANQALPPHLEKREGLQGARVYDFTFDFDFSPLQRRGASNVLLRIDYSDDPGYWNKVVAASPATKRRKRSEAEVHSEVRRNHGGSYKRYLDHLWQEDKRSTPDHELHELHARWFSAKVQDWFTLMRDVDSNYNLVRHRVDETMRWDLINDNVHCDFDNGISADGHLKVWANLNVNIETTAMVTLIGNLGDLSSFDQSHVLFRNSGQVSASFNVDALASVSFDSGSVELIGLQNFGATFAVPGIVTIGPNFRVLGNVKGSASVHGQARVDIKIADWDYTQTLPSKSGGYGDDTVAVDKRATDSQSAAVDPTNSLGLPKFYYDVDVQGEIAVTVTPQVTLGIVFVSPQVPDASIDFGISGRVRLYGSAGSSSTQTWQYCYGIDGEANVFARVNAPVLWKVDLNRYYDVVPKQPFTLLEPVCAAAGTKRSLQVSSPPGRLSNTASRNETSLHHEMTGSTVSTIPAGRTLARRDGILTSLLCPYPAADQNTACGLVKGYTPEELADSEVDDGGQQLRRRSLTPGSAPNAMVMPSLRLPGGRRGAELTMHGEDDTELLELDLHATEAERGFRQGSDLFARSGSQRYPFCEEPSMTYLTPDYPSGSVLYDCTDWSNCNDFSFGITQAEQPGTNYIAEHILERQMIQQFFLWAKLSRDPGQIRAGAQMPPDTTGSKDANKTPFTTVCEYLDYFWVSDLDKGQVQGKMAWDFVGSAWPSTTNYNYEVVRTADEVNGAKARAFKQFVAINDVDLLKGWSTDATKVNNLIKRVKDNIMVAKYMSHPTIQQYYLAQGRRVRDNFKTVETELAANWANTGATYVPMGLDTKWATFMKEYTTHVAEKLEEYINFWVGVLNRDWLQATAPTGGWTPAQVTVRDKITKLKQEADGLALFPNPF